MSLLKLLLITVTVAVQTVAMTLMPMQGKTVLITGGNSGLGKETAVQLASMGAEVVLLCKESEKTNSAVFDIIKRSRNGNVQAIDLNLASFDSIKKCVVALRRRLKKVDVLVNNAGVMAIPTRITTVEGIEEQLGVNHVGHFLLTNELFGLLKKADGEARIVNVASEAHAFGKFNREDLTLTKPGAYSPWVAYGNSKLANVLFTKSLNKKAQEKKLNICAVSCHPGVCRTDLGRYLFDSKSIPKFLHPLLGILASPLVLFTKSPAQGAETQIFLASSPLISARDSGGKYFADSREKKPSSEGQNMETAEWLWEATEKLCGKKFFI